MKIEHTSHIKVIFSTPFSIYFGFFSLMMFDLFAKCHYFINVELVCACLQPK